MSMERKIARTVRAGVLSISDKPLKKMKERSKVIPGEDKVWVKGSSFQAGISHWKEAEFLTKESASLK